MDAARRQQLLAFLEQLGLEPPAGLTDQRLLPLEEALTHTSAGRPYNHEQLEFLGDAVLRLAASEFLEQTQPQRSVGQRSALRAQLVSDRWLADLGQTCGIESVLRIGAVAAGDHTGRATLRAEACEAVIGALYRIWGDLTPVHRWLTPPIGNTPWRNWRLTPIAITGSQPFRNGARGSNADCPPTPVRR